MKKIKLGGVFVFILMLFHSCVMDYRSEIIGVKNNTADTVLIAYLPTEGVTDRMLYNQQFDPMQLDPHETSAISLPGIKPLSQPDEVKCYVYAFNLDSLNSFKKQKKVIGLYQHALIKTFTIQLNKVKDPVDTITIK